MDLNELTFENIGIWPVYAKAIIIGFACVIILALGYWFAIKPQIKHLNTGRLEEVDLRSTFEIKSSQASNLDVYKAQVEEVKKRLNTMLHQLPEETEVPNLIEDISKVGIASGLEFNLIKPEPEKALDFYAELPIEISVGGTYHEFAEFISSLAGLQRIVNVEDFSIERTQKSPQAQNNQQSASSTPAKLQMKMTAKTYHYLEEGGADDDAKQNDLGEISSAISN